MAIKFNVEITCLKCGSHDINMQAMCKGGIELECNKCGETEELV